MGGMKDLFGYEEPKRPTPQPEPAIDLLIALGWCKPTRLFINEFKPTKKCPSGMPIVEANPRTDAEARLLMSAVGGTLKQSKTGLYSGKLQWHVEGDPAVQLMVKLVGKGLHPYKRELANSWVRRWEQAA